MNNLEMILNDFYHCLSIPIQVVDKNFILIHEKGHSSDTYNLISNVSIFDDIKDNTLSIIKFTYFKDIHFIVMPILNNELYDGYFIVGPFKSKNICNEFDIPFKPFYCIDYISSMLKNIVNEKLFSTSFSSYISEAIEYIHKNYDKNIKIDDICNYLNINKSYFCTIFKKETGYTFISFLNKLRIEKSKEFLYDKNISILDVALSVGYNNHNYYTTIFKKFNGSTPMEYRNNIGA